MSTKSHYPVFREAEAAARARVEATGRHHVLWQTRTGWRVLVLNGMADRWLRATSTARSHRVLATREQRERRRRPRLLALFPRRGQRRYLAMSAGRRD